MRKCFPLLSFTAKRADHMVPVWKPAASRVSLCPRCSSRVSQEVSPLLEDQSAVCLFIYLLLLPYFVLFWPSTNRNRDSSSLYSIDWNINLVRTLLTDSYSMFDQMSGHLVAQSNQHIKLTIKLSVKAPNFFFP